MNQRSRSRFNTEFFNTIPSTADIDQGDTSVSFVPIVLKKSAN